MKYVCTLQNIITDYLLKRDKLIKTRMKIIPSYEKQSYMEKVLKIIINPATIMIFERIYMRMPTVCTDMFITVESKYVTTFTDRTHFLKKVVCITKTRHWTESTYILYVSLRAQLAQLMFHSS
jgi:hypothetical protein